MSPLRVLALGVGDAFSREHFSTCFAVQAEGAWLLVDCPHPIRRVLAESGARAGLPIDVGDLAACVVTHLHADHASGLESMGYFSFFALGRRMPLVLHPDVSARLWDGHLAAGMDQLLDPTDLTKARKLSLDDCFTLQALDETREITVGPFAIACRKTIHHVPTTALRIRAGGRTLGLSADTAFDPSLLAWLGDADLIVHETNLGAHTPYEKLAALPAALREKMRLVHYPDGFDAEPRAIRCLHEGDLLDV